MVAMCRRRKQFSVALILVDLGSVELERTSWRSNLFSDRGSRLKVLIGHLYYCRKIMLACSQGAEWYRIDFFPTMNGIIAMEV